MLTDKRIYQVGKIYTREAGRLSSTSGRQYVGLEDVTGISITSQKKIILSIISIILFILGGIDLIVGLLMAIRFGAPGMIVSSLMPLAGGVVLIIIYKKMSRKYLSIDYSGGNMLSVCSNYPESEIVAFQKAVSLEKEKFKAEEQKVTVPSFDSQPQSFIEQPQLSSNSLDDLEKLADLKQKGIITEAEFEKKKAELLSAIK